MAHNTKNCCTHKYIPLEALKSVIEKSLLHVYTEQNTRQYYLLFTQHAQE